MGQTPSNKIDLTGQIFGRLIVVSPIKVKKWISSWECLCDCGKTKIVLGRNARYRGKSIEDIISKNFKK